jgi:hypothetical protein
MKSSWYRAHMGILQALMKIQDGIVADKVKFNKQAFSNYIPPATGVFALFTGGGGNHDHLSTSSSGNAGAFQCSAKIIGRFAWKEEETAMDFASAVLKNATLLIGTSGYVNRMILQGHPDIYPVSLKKANEKTTRYIWEVTIDYLMLYTID